MAEKVYLYVYDMSQGLARALSGQILGKQIDGVWHTSVVVGNTEFYFGGGVQRSTPGSTQFGQPTRIIDLGTTEVTADVREELISDLANRFSTESYSLLTNNCNNFSNELATLLTGQGIPEDILNLPNDFTSTPIGQALKPMLERMENQLRNVREEFVLRPSSTSTKSSVSPSSQTQTPLPPASQNRQENRVPAGPATPLSSKQPAEKETTPDPVSREQNKAIDVAKVAFEEALKQEFSALMSQGGLTPNQAAALALQRVQKQHVKSGNASSKES